MLIAFTILVFFLTICSVLLLVQLFTRDKRILAGRLKQLATGYVEDEDPIVSELNIPFSQRVIKPLFKGIARGMSKLLPEGQKNSLEKKLVLAGNPGNLAPHEFITVQYLTTFVPPVLVSLVLIATGNIKNGLVPVLLSGLLGHFLPRLYLKKRTLARQEEIKKVLPDILDLLTVSVEAGLGFDAAVAKVAEKAKGTVAQEFSRLLKEIKMGKPRREALRDLAARVEVEDLSNFIGSVIQADQLGVSMANMLRVQSQQMRRRRRQAAEEKAMKAPIKMLFPLVIFIFPVIFIVILGPAIIRMMTVLFK